MGPEVIKAKRSTPSIVSAFTPQRSFPLDTHINNLGLVHANCVGLGPVAEVEAVQTRKWW